MTMMMMIMMNLNRRTFLCAALCLSLLLCALIIQPFQRLVPEVSAQATDPLGDPANTVNEILITDDGAEIVGQSRVQNFDPNDSDIQRNKPRNPDPKRKKISDALQRAIDSSPKDALLDVIVTFEEDSNVKQKIKRVRTLKWTGGDSINRDSSDFNSKKDQATAIIEEVKNERGKKKKEKDDLLKGNSGQIKENYWIANSVLATAPANKIKNIANQKNVISVTLNSNEGTLASYHTAAADSNPNNDPIMAAQKMSTSPFSNQCLNFGFIGVIDSGVRQTHTTLTGGIIASTNDCVFGDESCSGGFGPGDCVNHGTSMAALISANANQGARFAGITCQLPIDSWKVTGSCTSPVITISAAVKAFQKAVEFGDWVIVAGFAGTGGNPTDSLSQAANNAFDAGAVVIAPNGDYQIGQGSTPTVGSPAQANKVFGIGAFQILDGSLAPYSSFGATSDNRIKPDVTSPTGIETACATSNTCQWVFTGTSASAAEAAGVAALWRNYLANAGAATSGDPGQTYALMLLGGNRFYPSFNNQQGVGALNMPTNGRLWFGNVFVGHRISANIPLNVQGSAQELSCAIWWPTNFGAFNDIDLYLKNPSGTQVAASNSGPSVFEKQRTANPVAGTWTLRIYGYNVLNSPPQQVYYACFHKF